MTTTGHTKMLWNALLALASLSLASACCRRPPTGSPDGSVPCGTLCQITGDGVPSPNPLDFQDVVVGQSKTAKLTLKNMGSDTLNIADEALDGGAASDFKIIQKLPASESVGASVTATIQFTPSAAGERTAVLMIHTDGDPADVPVQLKGNGLDIEICAHPTTLDFGNVQVLGTPKTLPLNIGNCGGSPVNISFGQIQGPNATDFGETGESNQTLQPGQSVNVTVSYSPAAVGPSTASLPYDVCGGSCPQSVNLAGVGVDGQIVCSPNPVNFGTQPAGATPSMPVTCTNVGTENVNVANAGTFNANNVFVLSGLPTFPQSLAPLQNFSLTVNYNTTGQTSGDTDTLLLNWTVSDTMVPMRQYKDPLSGNQVLGPCSLSVSPSQVAFGNVAPGSTATQSATLSNLGGTVCNVSNVTISSSSDPAYALGSGQSTSFQVQPGSSAQVAVTFSPPTGAGPPLLRRGALTYTSDDPNNGNGSVPLTAYIGQQTQYQNGWPKWHMDNFNTGYTSADTSWLQGTVAWKYNIGAPSGGFLGTGTYINSPVIDGNGNVYQMNMSGKFYAISNAGSPIWAQNLSDPSGDPHPSTAAILKDGSMFVASGSDGSPPNLYYISSAGAVVFSEPFGEDGFDSCPALGADGTLFMADDDGPASSGGSGDPYSAIAFKASGSSVTQIAGLALPISTESERFGSVVASDDSTYWGNNGQFFGVTPPSAGFKQMTTWPAGGVTTSNAGTSDPNILSAVISDLALDTQTNNNLYAYSAWEDSSGTGYSVQGNLAALDPGTGAQRWIVTLPAAPLPSGSGGLGSDSGNAAPAIAADGTVYVGNGDGLRAIDGATGSVKWTFTSADVTSSPAIGGDGTVFFGVADGSFYAVHPDGTLRFKVPTGARISASPAIALDGTVVFVSDDGNVYAIH